MLTFLYSPNSHIHTWLLEKPKLRLYAPEELQWLNQLVHSTCKTIRTFVGKLMSLLFNILSRLAITFLPRSKCLLILKLQSTSTLILEPKKRKICHCCHFCPFYCILFWSDGTGCYDLSWLKTQSQGTGSLIFKLSFKPGFSALLFHLHQEAL